MLQKTLSIRLHRTAKGMVVTLALVIGLVALSATHALSQAGPDQTAKLLKSVESTVKSIGEARQQLEKTVAGYNSIMDQTAKDTKDAYKGLGKDIDASEKKVTESRAKVDAMNAEADRLFTSWKENAAGITDAALRKRSEERLADAQVRYQKIAAAGKDTRQHFEALMTGLKD